MIEYHGRLGNIEMRRETYRVWPIWRKRSRVRMYVLRRRKKGCRQTLTFKGTIFVVVRCFSYSLQAVFSKNKLGKKKGEKINEYLNMHSYAYPLVFVGEAPRMRICQSMLIAKTFCFPRKNKNKNKIQDFQRKSSALHRSFVENSKIRSRAWDFGRNIVFFQK